MKKPDNVTENPNILPYGSNVGAPAIKIENLQTWKESRIQKVNKQFENKFEKLKNEYEKLVEEYKWNEIIYNSKFNFEPTIGSIYHLYYSKKGEIFLSLIEPKEWNMEFISSFRYNYDNKWEKI